MKATYKQNLYSAISGEINRIAHQHKYKIVPNVSKGSAKRLKKLASIYCRLIKIEAGE